MQQRLAVLFVGALLVGAPTYASADTATLSPRVLQLTATLAALQARIASLTTDSALACAVVASKTQVRAGEPFVLAWSALGAVRSESGLSLAGAETIVLSRAGGLRYALKFYAADGSSTTCSTNIAIVPAS